MNRYTVYGWLAGLGVAVAINATFDVQSGVASFFIGFGCGLVGYVIGTLYGEERG